jgi:hypothetical protein
MFNTVEGVQCVAWMTVDKIAMPSNLKEKIIYTIYTRLGRDKIKTKLIQYC